jgi:small-conductance mechanosensitive channel
MERRATERILSMVAVEPAIVILLAALGSWVFYRYFLRDLSTDRHRLYREMFYDLLTFLVGAMVIFATHEIFKVAEGQWGVLERVLPYSGFVNVVLAAIIMVKILRIATYNFLFFNSKKAGVPQLLVNIISLLLSLVVLSLILTEIFEVKITSVLATSAVLSVVLGLAMQDTLGNLFAAISLQIDKPFSIGDWIELRGGNERISGQVAEISWRATVLLAITDEPITIPNRSLAQWQILNFNAQARPFIRSLAFRFPFESDIELARTTLLEAARSDNAILRDPEPMAMLSEITESWILVKLVYALNNYGQQYTVADRVQTKALQLFNARGIRLATARLNIEPQKPV